MKAIVFDRIGPPLEVLQLRDVPVPEIRDNEVLVKMTAVSINPGDFLFIQNLYPDPKKPHFPQQIAGNHGAGVITRVGKKASLQPGTLVGFSYYNAWAEYVAVPVEWLIPLPSDYPIEKAAQLVNPITAWDLLGESRVQPGQRLAVIELSSLSGGIGEQIMEITENHGVDGVIDCVGGALLGELIRCAASGGQVILYGGYRSERFELHNFDLLMKGSAIKSYIHRYSSHHRKKRTRSCCEKLWALLGDRILEFQ